MIKGYRVQYLTFLLLGIVILLSSDVNCRHRVPKFPWPKQTEDLELGGEVQTLYFEQKVSHYGYQMSGKTFKQKYLFDGSNWNKEEKGPILMYCGNEGPIEMFYRNTGWYNEVVGKELKGLLLYPEHRYFGTSMPFGDEKTSFQKENLVFLTTEEAMMDFVEFLRYIKKTYCEDCPVIVFGGSYGGMLATWMRMKYPFIVDAAHAASAPIYYYKNRKDFDLGVFYKIVTKNFKLYTSACPNLIHESYTRLLSYRSSPSPPLPLLSTYFNLCKPLRSVKDIDLLINYIDDAYSYMAMLNYPYPTEFLKKLPSWPANSSCLPLINGNLTVKSNDKELFNALRQSIEYFYSYNSTKCNEIFSDQTSDEDMSGWDVLACGDQAMPMGMDGKEDMFYQADFDYQLYSKECKENYGIEPDYEYTLNHFGGVTDKELNTTSRIVWTNGDLDPWSGGSPSKSFKDDLVTCIIEYGAHHLDLRSPNPADPRSVIECRNVVIENLKKWIKEINEEKSSVNSENEEKSNKFIRFE